MRLVVCLTLALAISSCSREPEPVADPVAESSAASQDFANRVMAGGAAASPAAAAPSAPSVAPIAAPPKITAGAAPAGADVFALQQLGDISSVDLGPRAGGCTFTVNGAPMLVAAGPADAALPGKAAVRIGGQVIPLDTPPGGMAAVRAGTRFLGEGFAIAVTPAGRRAQAVITNGKGEQKSVNGDWVCS